MKTMSVCKRLLLGGTFSIMAGVTPVQAAPPVSPAKFGQVDGGFVINCPASSQFNPSSIPPQNGVTIQNLTVTLHTYGNPVVIYFSGRVELTQSSIIEVRPTIDGVSPDKNDFAVYINNGYNQPNVTQLSMLRVYPLAAGNHTFGMQAACPSSPFVGSINTSWLTVFELGGVFTGADNRGNSALISPFNIR